MPLSDEDINNFRSKIDEDLMWRKEEIAFFESQLNNLYLLGSPTQDERDKAQDKFRKPLVLMLYSHFEGFFREALTIYVEAINTAQIETRKALDNLTAAALMKPFKEYHDDCARPIIGQVQTDEYTKQHNILKARADFLIKINEASQDILVLHASTTHKDAYSLVNTNSNLTPQQIEINLARLGLPIAELFDSDQKRDIDAFVNMRNSVAHGSKEHKDGIGLRFWDRYKTLCDKVMNFIPKSIRKALVDKLYLKPEHRNET
jgi:hypothetical protein